MSLAVHEVVLVGARQMDARLDKVGVHVGNRPVPIHHFVGDSQLLHEFDAGGRLLARIAHQIFVKLALAALQVVLGMLLRRVVGHPGKRLLLFRSGSLNDAGRVHRVAARHGRSFQHHDVRAATRRYDGGGQPRTSGADDQNVGLLIPRPFVRRRLVRPRAAARRTSEHAQCGQPCRRSRTGEKTPSRNLCLHGSLLHKRPIPGAARRAAQRVHLMPPNPKRDHIGNVKADVKYASYLMNGMSPECLPFPIPLFRAAYALPHGLRSRSRMAFRTDLGAFRFGIGTESERDATNPPISASQRHVPGKPAESTRKATLAIKHFADVLPLCSAEGHQQVVCRAQEPAKM